MLPYIWYATKYALFSVFTTGVAGAATWFVGVTPTPAAFAAVSVLNFVVLVTVNPLNWDDAS